MPCRVKTCAQVTWRGNAGNMNWSKAIANWIQGIAVMIAIAAFLTPLLTPPTEDNPTADVGLFAPVVALCVAAMLLTQAMQVRGLPIRPIPGICIGIGSMVSAYFWMADEAGVHARDLDLPVVLLVLLGLAAVATVSIPILTLMSKPQSSDRSPSEEVDC